MKYNGIVISDIHIGAFSINRLKKELDDIFFDYINKLKKLDFLIIDGDLFDKKFYLNDVNAEYVMDFFSKLKDVCKEKNTKVRIVYGTASHENNQYSCVSTIQNEIDIDVIYHVKEEELLPGMNVLYLPEEQMYSKYDFYQDYFSNINKYAYIFGHGIIRETMKQAAIKSENQDQKRKKVPVFSTAEFRKICYGETYFGHYHINTDMGDVFYVGSFSRWQFGEDEPKGFYYIECNLEKNKFKHIFIENTLADIYKTVSLKNTDIVNSDNDLDKKVKRIDNLIEDESIDHIRFIIDIPRDYENPEYLMEYLKERYKSNNKVKLDIVDGYTEEKKEIRKKAISDEEEKYGFIKDDNLQMEDVVKKFISVEYSRDIPLKNIQDYLYKPLNEILLDENTVDS